MPPRPQGRFLLAFAWQDLSDRRALGSTLVIVITVSLVTALTALSLGLPRAAERARHARLKEEPLALCLWAWEADGLAGRPLTMERVSKLRGKLSEKLGDDALVGIFPYREARLDWLCDGEATESIRLLGLTLSPGDPLLRNLHFTAGGPFADANQRGVIATMHMLELLGYPLDMCPGTILHIRGAGSGERVAVPLVGVLRDHLPHGHAFVLTEGFERDFRVADADVPARTITTGPVPDAWPRPRFLPDRVQEALDAFKVNRPLYQERTGKEAVWEMTSNRDVPPVRGFWRDQVKRIHELMREENYPEATGFEEIEAPGPSPESLDRRPFSAVGVYVTELSALKAADPVIRSTGLQTNDGVVLQLAAYDEATSAAEYVLLGIVWIVGLVALINLVAVQALRMEKKGVEIGMLRAIGVSNRTVRVIFGIEVGILWLIGSAVGLGVAGAIGALLVWWGAIAELTSPDWWRRFALFLGLSALFCWGSTWAATWRVCRVPPAASLTRQ